MTQKPRFVLFAHNATYDKLHQVATLGMTAAAMGKDVIVVLLFWTIKSLQRAGSMRRIFLKNMLPLPVRSRVC